MFHWEESQFLHRTDDKCILSLVFDTAETQIYKNELQLNALFLKVTCKHYFTSGSKYGWPFGHSAHEHDEYQKEKKDKCLV